MADLAGARVITEDELDSTTLGSAIEEILGMFILLPTVGSFWCGFCWCGKRGSYGFHCHTDSKNNIES